MQAGFIGMDGRTVYMKEYVEAQGIETVQITRENREQIGTCRILVLPVPMMDKQGWITGVDGKMNWREVTPFIRKETKIFAGAVPQEVVFFLQRCRIAVTDLLEQEEVSECNSRITAEGCLIEAVAHSKQMVRGRRCLVLGFGKCGKQMCHILKQMDAEVTVWDSAEEVQSEISSAGYQLWKRERTECNYEWVFHMTDKRTAEREFLHCCRSADVVIDITSGGGIDYKQAEQEGIAAVYCPGLPGKYAPKCAGRILGEAVIKESL